MILSTGIDMIEVDRIRKAITRHGTRFLNRIFTVQEQEECAGNVIRLAGRYAVKEAVAKAFGTGIGDIRWLDIEIIIGKQGKPLLQLHNTAAHMAQRQGLAQWAISLSHTKTHAIGIAVANSQ